MLSRWLAAVLILIPVLSSASSFPTEPVNPTSTAECKQLSREYHALIDQLQDAHSRLGLGKGPQVDAGGCCQAAAATRQWCRTYQSHAALWEEIHCASNQRRSAVERCMDKVRARKNQVEQSGTEFDVGRFVRLDALAEPEHFEAAYRLLNYVDGVHLIRAWTRAGNDPHGLSGLVLDTAKFAVVASPGFDPVAREVIADNLDMIGVVHTEVLQTLDNVSRKIEREFPQVRISAPSIGGSSSSAIVFICWESESGGAPRCEPSPYPLNVLQGGGAECVEAGDEIHCF